MEEAAAEERKESPQPPSMGVSSEPLLSPSLHKVTEYFVLQPSSTVSQKGKEAKVSDESGGGGGGVSAAAEEEKERVIPVEDGEERHRFPVHLYPIQGTEKFLCVSDAPENQSTADAGLKTVSIRFPRSTLIHDLFHGLATQRSRLFFLSIISIILCFWLVLGALLYAGGGMTIHGGDSFGDCFLFVMQTWSACAFGSPFYPWSSWSQVLSCIVICCQLIVNPCIIGLIFARFSRPKPLINFSVPLLVTRSNGRRVLMFRLANGRSNNSILNASLTAVVLKEESSKEAGRIRRMFDLRLTRDTHPLFQLVWTCLHDLDDPNSPLFGITPENSDSMFRTLLVILRGYDSDLHHTLYGSHMYYPESIVWDMQFEDMFAPQHLLNHMVVLDHSKMNVVKPSQHRYYPAHPPHRLNRIAEEPISETSVSALFSRPTLLPSHRTRVKRKLGKTAQASVTRDVAAHELSHADELSVHPRPRPQSAPSLHDHPLFHAFSFLGSPSRDSQLIHRPRQHTETV